MSGRLSLVSLLALLSVAPACRSNAEAAPAERSTSAVGATPSATPAPLPPGPSGPWNAAQIEWQPYEEGLAKAKAEGKPVCLVLSTSWCPHCRSYSHVFDDARVAERARDFVMIHLDADANEAINRQYSPDGVYIPRTFFLSPDGTLDPSLHAPRPRFQYFYDERDPSSVLGGMQAALTKLHP
jgi:thiol:disulfide interchange protein